jgi:hypothetical protein
MSAIVETGRLEIKDLDKALYHLGNVYEDPRDALAEFVTNGIDAGAQRIVIHLHRRGATGRIEVDDDGSGMTAADLGRVARSICDSVKALDERTVGEKGIGILGYQEFADECQIMSRAEGDAETNVLCLHRGRRDFEIVRPERSARRELAGTTIKLLKIEKQRMRQFTLAKVEEHLKRKFRVHLANGDVQITLVEGKDARHVQHDEYKGVPFYVNQVRTPFGDVRLSLYIVPGGRSETVSVYHKGNLVCPITDLDEFQHEPWTLGKVAGEISNDFNKVTTGRGGFVHHRSKWAAWINAIFGVEADLEAEIERLTREATDEANRQMHKRLREAFLKALTELPSFAGIAVPVAHPYGDLTTGSPKEESTAAVPSNGDGKRKRHRHERQLLDPSDRSTPARSGAGFNLMEVPIHEAPDLRSDFDERTVLIRVNTLHPDYGRETDTADRKESYLVRLIAKEMTLHEYPDTHAANLMEKLLDLELAARRYLIKGRARAATA